MKRKGLFSANHQSTPYFPILSIEGRRMAQCHYNLVIVLILLTCFLTLHSNHIFPMLLSNNALVHYKIKLHFRLNNILASRIQICVIRLCVIHTVRKSTRYPQMDPPVQKRRRSIISVTRGNDLPQNKLWQQYCTGQGSS